MPGSSFTNGQVPTLAEINAFLTSVATADLANGAVTPPKIGTLPHVRVRNSTNISIANNTATALTFDTERWDSENIHSTVTNTSRLTCVTAGLYEIKMQALWDVNATGVREGYIRLNGTTLLALEDKNATSVAAIGTGQLVTTQYRLIVGDYVEAVVAQTSGGALNILAGGNYSPEFMMTWVGP